MLAAAHALVDALIARGITDPDDVERVVTTERPRRKRRPKPRPP
jgi:hypothetical protein